MMGMSLCKKLGSLCLLLALCVFVIGCGGANVDALAKEHKQITEEIMKAKSPEEGKAAKAKMDSWKKKVDALSNEQKLEVMKKIGP